MITVPARNNRYSSPEVILDRFLGADYSTVPSQIDIRRASDMENCMLDTDGMLQQIPGYRKVITGTVSAGTTPVRMITRNATSEKFIKSHGGKLYTFNPDGPETLLYNGVADAIMHDFVMGAYQYFKDGTNYLRWNGSGSVESVEANAYIPTTVIGRLPAGGGTTFEAVNLLQPKRKNSFRGNGTSTVYYLDTTNLDATAVSAVVAGVTINEGSGLTVNRTTGAVTFTTAPADGNGVDNVIITFAKTVAGYADRIKNCTFLAIFGTGNNLRVFVSGNPNFKNYDWYSGLQDPTYFPDLNYTMIGSEGVAIKGYALQQGVMHIIKEESGFDINIWTRTIDTYSDNTIRFPVRPQNSSIGMVATETVKGINDVPIFLSLKGVYRITSTYIEDERGLDLVSKTMNPKLLKESNLKDAISFDHDGKYGIAINGYVYVFDYNNGFESYRWKGINASCFFDYGGELYFGDKSSGNVFVLNKLGDENNINSFDGVAIESLWKSKMMAMDRPNFYKMIDNLAVTLVPLTSHTNVDIYISTNRRTEKFVKNVSISVFDANDLDADDINLSTSELPQTINREVNLSDIIYFQIILKNNKLGCGMSVSNITIPYSYAGEI